MRLRAMGVILVLAGPGLWTACSGGTAEIPQPDLSRLPPDQLVFELARIGDLQNMQALVDALPQVVYVQDVNDETPLHVAAANGHDGIVSLLLQRGANPQVVNANGDTPAGAAQRRGHRSTARLLTGE